MCIRDSWYIVSDNRRGRNISIDTRTVSGNRLGEVSIERYCRRQWTGDEPIDRSNDVVDCGRSPSIDTVGDNGRGTNLSIVLSATIMDEGAKLSIYIVGDNRLVVLLSTT